jgi:cysteinyl-tRNA synthetase
VEDADDHRRIFEEALDRLDSDAAVAALLELDERLAAWATDTLESDELDRGRSVLRGMVVRLGEISQAGLSNPRQTVEPYVDLLLHLREEARRQKRYTDADMVRTTLTSLGVEVHDSPTGTEWSLTPKR